MNQYSEILKPYIMNVSVVASNILMLRVQEGHVTGGVQIPYQEEVGESLEMDTVFPDIVYIVKDSKRIGVKVEDKQLGTKRFPFEELIGEELDVKAADMTESYLINDKSPLFVYRKTKPNNIVDPYDQFTKLHCIYLIAEQDFIQGEKIRIATKTGLFHSDLTEITFCSAEHHSEAIHVNQIGFRKDDPAKKAYLSQWMGLGGSIAYESEKKFFLIDDTGKQVFEGCVKLQNSGDPVWMGNSEVSAVAPVYELDFSAFMQEGIYRVMIPSLGCSFPFFIGEQNTWLKGFYASMNGMYCHRSGIHTGKPYSDFERPRCYHPADGQIVYQSECSLFESGNGCNCYGTDSNNFGNLIRKATDQTVENAWGGYFDACDWDRRIQHLHASQMQTELYLMFPDYFRTLILPIPESGNGIPDILNEVLYNVDFYKRLQLPNGGIRGGIEQEEHPLLGQCGWQDTLKAYAYAPDFWSSYYYTSAAARVAFALGSICPDKAEEYQKSAEKAFDYAERTYLQAREKEEHKWTRHAVSQVILARELAACDLFRLTGDQKYEEIYLNVRNSQSFEASFIYCTLPSGTGSAEIKERCRNEILAAADRAVLMEMQMPFHLPTENPAAERSGPYSNFCTVPRNTELIRAHYLSGDSKYLAAAILAAGFGTGANPDNMCYTTGIGSRYPQNILHHDSRMTGQESPVGITVFGPHNFNYSDEVLKRVLLVDPIWPGAYVWPSLESYLDIYRHPSVTEYTVTKCIGPNSYQWGYFAARASISVTERCTF